MVRKIMLIAAAGHASFAIWHAVEGDYDRALLSIGFVFMSLVVYSAFGLIDLYQDLAAREHERVHKAVRLANSVSGDNVRLIIENAALEQQIKKLKDRKFIG